MQAVCLQNTLILTLVYVFNSKCTLVYVCIVVATIYIYTYTVLWCSYFWNGLKIINKIKTARFFQRASRHAAILRNWCIFVFGLHIYEYIKQHVLHDRGDKMYFYYKLSILAYACHFVYKVKLLLSPLFLNKRNYIISGQGRRTRLVWNFIVTSLPIEKEWHFARKFTVHNRDKFCCIIVLSMQEFLL